MVGYAAVGSAGMLSQGLNPVFKTFKYTKEKKGGQVSMTSYHHNAPNNETKFQLQATTRKMKLEICKPLQALGFYLLFPERILKISGPAL